MGRIYAGILGLVAFVTVVARGLLHQGAAGQGMLYAAGFMFIFAAVGWIAGTIAQTTVAEAVRRQLDAEMSAKDNAAAES